MSDMNSYYDAMKMQANAGNALSGLGTSITTTNNTAVWPQTNSLDALTQDYMRAYQTAIQQTIGQPGIKQMDMDLEELKKILAMKAQQDTFRPAPMAPAEPIDPVQAAIDKAVNKMKE